VLEALQRRGVDAAAVDGIPALAHALTDPAGRRYDRVFNILHGNRGGGEDGVLQGLLDALGVPYTGSGVLGSALSMDKIRPSRCGSRSPSDAGVREPRARRRRGCSGAQLGLPVIVKPAREGSSVGVSRCFKDADLDAAVELATRYEGPLLVEQLIQGEEYTVGVLGSEALPSIRIVPAGEYYDYHAKYVAEDTQYICPGSSGATEQELGSLALAAFFAVDCHGWGRVDFMRDRAGKSWLLEVNTAPGMTSHSLVPKAARQLGIDFDDLVWRVLETSFAARSG